MKYILDTPDHLHIIETKLSKLEYQKFLEECNSIKTLDDWTITSEPVSTLSVPNEQRLEETSNKLEALKALVNKNELTSTEVRIKSMEEEIRKLQLQNHSKEKERKSSLKSTTERLSKTKNKKRLIDGIFII